MNVKVSRFHWTRLEVLVKEFPQPEGSPKHYVFMERGFYGKNGQKRMKRLEIPAISLVPLYRYNSGMTAGGCYLTFACQQKIGSACSITGYSSDGEYFVHLPEDGYANLPINSLKVDFPPELARISEIVAKLPLSQKHYLVLTPPVKGYGSLPVGYEQVGFDIKRKKDINKDAKRAY